MKISSQKYINQETVEAKISASDYTVILFRISDEMDMVVDGHHSLEAAKQAGVDPVFEYAEGTFDIALRQELECLGLDDFLTQHYMDSDWYDVETGHPAF